MVLSLSLQVLLSSTFCLSDQWCRTIKYLTAVAVGLPCLEYDWVFVQYNFLKFNVLEGQSAIFGIHPWHW